MYNFKAGDKFIINGPEEALDSYSLIPYKNTVRIVLRVDRTMIYFQNPVANRPDAMEWYCPLTCAKPLTKLHKVLY